MSTLRIDLSGADAPECVLAPLGELDAGTVDTLRTALHTCLREVLVDLGGLNVTAAAATHVFPSALTDAGGWPTARLVMFGADPPTRDVLRGERIPATVPLAADQDAARTLLGTRPERISRCCGLPGDLTALGQAHAFVERVRTDWGVTGRYPDAVIVANELITNAVEHTGTPSVLTVSLDPRGLHLAVRDGSTGGVAPIRSGRARQEDGRGLYLVSELTRAWGVTVAPDGKTVWAVLGR